MLQSSGFMIGENLSVKFIPESKDGLNIELRKYDVEKDKLVTVESCYVSRDKFRSIINGMLEIDNELENRR